MVLNGLNFSISQKETIAIVGSSGCGKSTLLRLLAGLLDDNMGTRKGDININGLSPREYRQMDTLAFMFQEPTLMDNLSVWDNTILPLKIKRSVIEDEKIGKLLNDVGLGKDLQKLPKELSGGMKTRVALARSFVTKPVLLLLDEPFSSLDIAWKETLYQELDSLKEKNQTTVVLVTHDIEEAFRLTGGNIIVLGIGGVMLYDSSKSGYISQKEVRELIFTNHKGNLTAHAF